MRNFLSVLFLITSLNAGEINVAVAANVSYAMDELKREFSKISPKTKIRVILGSSGKLSSQIRNGAPYGIFMAANMIYPQSLFNDKLATTKPQVYAEGYLAYFSHKERDFSRGFSLFKEEGIRKVAVANYKTAPYGKASLEAMRSAGIYEAIKDKLVYAESISQTVFYTVNAADIGIIAKSSLYSSKMRRYKENIHWATIDTKLYNPIKQGIVLLKHAKKSQEYQKFYDFVLSVKAKTILRKYGYITR